MPHSLETLVLTDGLMKNALADFARLAEILIPLVRMVHGDLSDVEVDEIQHKLEKAVDITVVWCP